MFSGTADGRVVKFENGEVDTIARFGSGPCSKSVPVPLLYVSSSHSERCQMALCKSGSPLEKKSPDHLAESLTWVLSCTLYLPVVLGPYGAWLSSLMSVSQQGSGHGICWLLLSPTRLAILQRPVLTFEVT